MPERVEIDRTGDEDGHPRCPGCGRRVGRPGVEPHVCVRCRVDARPEYFFAPAKRDLDR